MAIEDIPVFRAARRGKVVRSDDWNGMQQELRNAIRSHRHTGAPTDDASDTDTARQITTQEIGDDMVTLGKLGPEVRDLIDRAGRQEGVATGEAEVSPQEPVRIEHGLGAVPVAVAVGVRRENVFRIEGRVVVYGFSPAVPPALAAVPEEPDGTFFLVTEAEESVQVRWWAFSAQEAE